MEDLDVLLDDAGLGYREIHEGLEKLGHPRSRNGGRVQELEVASDAALLLGSKLGLSDVLDESDHVHGGVPCFMSLLAVYARNDDEPFVVLFP